jgi:two-component system sensor histidine kinase UhpB
MDGYTLLRHWKADAQLKTIPFIVYTATYTQPKDEKLALDLGADAFILKPAEPEPFVARLREVLAKEVRGDLAPANAPAGEEQVLLKEYSEILVRKLEERTLQLEQANRALQEVIARRDALSRRLLEVQETERRSIARELHDEVGGVLTAVKLNLQSLRRTRGGDPREAALADGLALVDGAIQAVRSLSLDLRPAVLDDLGLIPALKWYCERQALRAGIPIDLALDAIDLKLAPQLESACFRIVQEAVTNALRHAKAGRMQVALRRDNGSFVMEITDDGSGYDVAAARQRGLAGQSSGLLGMEERAILLGGRLSIDSAPGAGTRVRAVFALPEGGFA